MHIWHYSTNVEYSVKSAYRLIMDTAARNDPYKLTGCWSKIWKLKVKPKLRNFAWRLCRGCIPTRTAFQYRGVSISSLFEMCSYGFESACHIFILYLSLF